MPVIETEAKTERTRRNFILGATFTVLVLADLSLFLVPAFIIRPFKYQSPTALALAMAAKQQAPLWTFLLSVMALVLAVILWRWISTLNKALLSVGLCLACAATFMARADYFEWMFHPVSSPGYESADRVQLDASEMVMAVRFGTDARAFPIREMAYHHVVNDIVGGVPITATY